MKKIKAFLIAASLMTLNFAHADLESMKQRIPVIVDLKEKGIVGEQPDGLLGLIKEDAEAKKIVEEENADRLSVYKDRAEEQGQPLPVFMKVLGEAKVRQEKSGRFIKDKSGSWVKK